MNKRCSLCGLQINADELMHDKCKKELFGVGYIPDIKFGLSDIVSKAQKMAGKLSISGVQPKLSLKLNSKKKELEVVAEGGEYILKPPVEAYFNLPQNENLCMTIASNLGITVPPHSLIKLQDNKWAYIVKRFDRLKTKKIHQEDFFQILNKKDKYSGSFEEIGKEIKGVSSVPGLDIQLLYERILYYFIIGNGDAHLKNFSITYKDDQIRLAPAYDIVCSKIYFPGEEDFALSINGKRNNIEKKDFDALFEYLNIPNQKINRNILDKKDIIIELISDSLLEEQQKIQVINIVKDRSAKILLSF